MEEGGGPVLQLLNDVSFALYANQLLMIVRDENGLTAVKGVHNGRRGEHYTPIHRIDELTGVWWGGRVGQHVDCN